MHARATDVVDAVAAVRGPLEAASAGCGGPRTSGALTEFAQELTARADACTEALQAAGVTLAQSATEIEAVDRLPSASAGTAGSRSIRETLG